MIPKLTTLNLIDCHRGRTSVQAALDRAPVHPSQIKPLTFIDVCIVCAAGGFAIGIIFILIIEGLTKNL